MPKTKSQILWPKNTEPGFVAVKEAAVSDDSLKPAYNLLRWGFLKGRLHGLDKRYPIAAGEHTKALCEYQGRTPDSAEKKIIKAGEARRKQLENA